MRVTILYRCQKELAVFPLEIREQIADAALRLNEGLQLSMPLSRPMHSIGRGVHELRLKDHSRVFRVIYAFTRGKIYFVHAFVKKSQQTSKQNIELAKKRLKEVL